MVGAKRSAGGARQEEERDDNAMMTDEVEGLEFEDPYGDVFEEESLEDNEVDEEDIEEVEGEEFDATHGDGMQTSEPAAEAVEEPASAKQVWRPGIDQLPEGEELEYDPSAYIMYHSMRTEWPCLSFDVIRDTLGDNRLRVSAAVSCYDAVSRQWDADVDVWLLGVV